MLQAVVSSIIRCASFPGTPVSGFSNGPLVYAPATVTMTAYKEQREANFWLSMVLALYVHFFYTSVGG